MKPATKRAGWLAVAVTAICAYEGLALNEYPDVGGVPTICYGETKGVRRGDTATRAQCDEKLSARLVEFNVGVNSCVKVDLPDSRRAAFVSLAYNVGVPAFCRSTVVKRINASDTAGACDAMLLWNRVNGKPVQGLTNRRTKERALCMKGNA